MHFKVQFWDDKETLLHDRWFDSIKDAMFYVEGLKKLEDITSITVSQTLYEFEK